ERRNLPVAAFFRWDAVLQAGLSHRYSGRAVERLARLQVKLGDPYLIPNELNRHYDSSSWSVLPEETLSRINLMIAQVDLRKGKLDECALFVSAVPATSTVHARARYLEGLVLADPRYPAADAERALAAFRAVIDHADSQRQEDFDSLRALATIGMGRVLYGQ